MAPVRKDGYFILGIILVSFLARIFFLSHPSETVFDEGAYATFLSNDIHRVHYFDIHPPLARMLFTTPYDSVDADFIYHKHTAVNKSFGDFPYVPARRMSVIIGTLIPPLLYILVRMIGVRPRYALLVGVASALDQLFIIYSRTILPDSVLWVSGLLSILFALFAVREKGWRMWLFAFLSALLIGAAFSVKWTGGVFGVVAVIIFLIYISNWKKVVLLSLLTAAVASSVYVGVWMAYLSALPPSVPLDEARGLYDHYPGRLLTPENVSFGSAARYAYLHAKAAIAVQHNPEFMDKVLAYGYPEKWPISMDVMGVWVKYGVREKIVLSGNFPAYILSAVALLVLIASVCVRLYTKKGTIEREEALILASYSVLYLSIVLMSWSRPMFLYHYVAAYFFALMALGYGLDRFSRISERDGQLAYRLTFSLIVVFFFLQSLHTYGM